MQFHILALFLFSNSPTVILGDGHCWFWILFLKLLRGKIYEMSNF